MTKSSYGDVNKTCAHAQSEDSGHCSTHAHSTFVATCAHAQSEDSGHCSTHAHSIFVVNVKKKLTIWNKYSQSGMSTQNLDFCKNLRTMGCSSSDRPGKGGANSTGASTFHPDQYTQMPPSGIEHCPEGGGVSNQSEHTTHYGER